MHSKRQPLLDDTLPLRQHTIPTNDEPMHQRIRAIEKQMKHQRNPVYKSELPKMTVMSPERAKATVASYMPMPKQYPVVRKTDLPKLTKMPAARAKATVEDYMLNDRKRRKPLYRTTDGLSAESCGKGWLVKTKDYHYYYVEPVDK